MEENQAEKLADSHNVFVVHTSLSTLPLIVYNTHYVNWNVALVAFILAVRLRNVRGTNGYRRGSIRDTRPPKPLRDSLSPQWGEGRGEG
jgi:hypothetical protein